MNLNDEVNRLAEFTEEVAKIKCRGFAKYIESSDKLGYTISITPDQTVVDYLGPSEDEVISFVMSCRFFLQENERINIPKVLDGIRLVTKGNEAIQEQVDAWESEYRKFSNTSCKVQNFRYMTKAKIVLTSNEILNLVSDDQKRFTKLELLKHVIYGEIAHKDKEKQRALRDQLNDPISKDALTAEFQLCLFEFWFLMLGLNEICRISVRD